MALTAFVFPGQGSQRVGMGLDILGRRPDLADTYYRVADEVLGFELSELCLHGPADRLQDTAVTQPAVFLTSLIVLDVLRAHDVDAALVAGHSLGEYAALVAADVLDWTDALRLVALRGRLMGAVNRRTPGAMAAVLDLDPARVEAVCAAAAAESGQVVEVANLNEPGQTVVSGQVTAVRKASEAALAAGARRVVPLRVGAPFHSSLMRDIEDEFAESLASVAFREPRIQVLSSVTAEPVGAVEEIVAALRRQLTAPVRWTGTVTAMAERGASRFVEVGPGRVLAGLCRRIAPGLPAHGTGTVEEIARTVEDVLAATGAASR
ncbi:ACP S-malonyltransferase [Streptomyces cylindrosporus]|uniref:Malonyl CoA-acyl carrier protein transacylase n=1 Tax=Streptomyces cylindrosporus TaxID=2927583 RepID=A0ABS9YN27_9ACTN|nr:ACP S-malonyltransferase [Streptomyces cylindrosporus]MCI3278550.1 ACP S-malonyltransferase [Streptomyces cylindrosporus]